MLKEMNFQGRKCKVFILFCFDFADCFFDFTNFFTIDCFLISPIYKK